MKTLASDGRFSDGTRYRVEIPSVEGPNVMRAVLEGAHARDVPVRRISQGSGVMMLTDAELDGMAELGRQHNVEVSLFIGPRGEWDTGGQAKVTRAAASYARGEAGVEHCVAEVVRGLSHGILSYLVGDLGVLAVLGRMRAEGRFPPELVLKTSVLLTLRERSDCEGARGPRRDNDQRRNRRLRH